jgi:hypothetical protein
MTKKNKLNLIRRCLSGVLLLSLIFIWAYRNFGFTFAPPTLIPILTAFSGVVLLAVCALILIDAFSKETTTPETDKGSGAKALPGRARRSMKVGLTIVILSIGFIFGGALLGTYYPFFPSNLLAQATGYVIVIGIVFIVNAIFIATKSGTW